MLVVWQRRAAITPPAVCEVPSLGHPYKEALEERREGLKVETPASADRQAGLLTGDQGREDDSPGTLHGGGRM